MMKKAVLAVLLFLAIGATVNAQTYSTTLSDAEVEQELDKFVGIQQPSDEPKEPEITEYRVQSSGLREDVRLAFYGWMKWNGVIYKGLYDIHIILQAKGW